MESGPEGREPSPSYRGGVGIGIFGAAVVVMALLPLILAVVLPPTSPPLLPCSSEPTGSSPVTLGAGETSVVVVDYGGNSRATVWSSSTVTYALFLLTQSEYASYGNTTGSNGTIPFHPPTAYYWTSGMVTTSETTFRLGADNWYVMAYNPGATSSVVDVEVDFCALP